ncbi:PREDICTED: protein SABRE-like [Nicotiana attenuata]|uniref:protein SABRE-like n=1 Tax=Nicotiana attenuata TaxID=49451 RepID=UPI0009055C8C|nr:PREDICTED: protein SABRE-like [Nicotiana attenuata]
MDYFQVKSDWVQRLKKDLVNAQKSRKVASASLRMALRKAAQLRLIEKEKNKSPSCAMRISLQINKVVWSMLVDGRSFAEAEINDMIYDFDRDYKDVGVAKFTTKYFVVRNCYPNAKYDMLLSARNPPTKWEKCWYFSTGSSNVHLQIAKIEFDCVGDNLASATISEYLDTACYTRLSFSGPLSLLLSFLKVAFCT